MDGSGITPPAPENSRADTAILDLGATRDVLVKGRAVVVVGPEAIPVLIVRTLRGVFATRNRCPHRGLPLNDALVRGRHITCPELAPVCRTLRAWGQ